MTLPSHVTVMSVAGRPVGHGDQHAHKDPLLHGHCPCAPHDDPQGRLHGNGCHGDGGNHGNSCCGNDTAVEGH